MTKHLVVVALVLTPALAAAEPGTHVDLETSPAFFALDGYFAAIGVAPAATPRWRFVASAFGLEIPQAFTDSKNVGWSQHDNGFGLGAERTFGRADRGGWFAGTNVAVQQRRASRAGGSGAPIEEDLELAAGYRWYPARSLGLAITPSLGIAVPLHRGAAPTVDGMTYVYQPVSFIPSVNVGYSF